MAAPIENNTYGLQELLRIANSLPEATGQSVLQAKTVSPTTQKQTYTPDPGYDGFSSFTVNAMQTAQQATPSISVSSSGLITASATQTEGYVSAGTKSATKQLTVQSAKTVTPSTSEQTAVASGVYTTGAVKVAALPTTTQATPSISVDSAGKITASATQTAGYVTAGTKSATQQLTTQAAQTITPGTSDKTIAAGRYLTGAQTIKGDANLKAENIAQGVSIFGISGTLKPGGTMTDAQVALSTSKWSSKKQTVSVSGVTTDATIVVYGDDASEPEYGMCGVKCSGQANGSLTFSCDYLPSINLVANVLIFT